MPIVPTNSNSFIVLNSYDNDDLEELANSCNIILGDNVEITHKTIEAIKLEELAIAAIAEARYKQCSEKIIAEIHVLEEECLRLCLETGVLMGIGAKPPPHGGSTSRRGDLPSQAQNVHLAAPGMTQI
jgi:hypothetical protein